MSLDQTITGIENSLVQGYRIDNHDIGTGVELEAVPVSTENGVDGVDIERRPPPRIDQGCQTATWPETCSYDLNYRWQFRELLDTRRQCVGMVDPEHRHLFLHLDRRECHRDLSH